MVTFQKVLGKVRKAITDYDMIQENDHIVVGVSGGKDSMLLLKALASLKSFYSIPFTLSAVHVNLGFDQTTKQDLDKIENFAKSLKVNYYLIDTNIGPLIFNDRKEKSPCSLCSKMRRGALNNKAIEIGANKIALGHHLDDALETLFMAFTSEGRLYTFQPTVYMDRTKITLIRPFIYVTEEDISYLIKKEKIPTIFNPCPSDKHTNRELIKDLINSIDQMIPKSKKLMFSALLHPERTKLWDKNTDINKN